MSSSQGGGTPLPNYYPVPKYIVLLQHGWDGSPSNFDGFIAHVNNTQTFLLNHVAKGSDEISALGIPLKNLEISLQTQGKTLLDKTLFIKTEFAHKRGSVYDQSDELNVIVDYLKFIYQNQGKIILVGHSKGGLVGIDYASYYTGKIHGLISIATPYNYQFIWNAFSGDDTLSNPNALTSIKNEWNGLENKPKAYALASQAYPITKQVCSTFPMVCWFEIDDYTDTVVNWKNAKGQGYQNIQSFSVGYGNTSYTHMGMLSKTDLFDMVKQLINSF